MTQSELKPCPNPWCDDRNFAMVETREGGFFRVGCTCGVATPAFTEEAQAIAAWNTRANYGKIPQLPNPSEPLVERVAETDRVLPEAPHWNGHGKYGPALCMDECTLHIMSRGFGAKDGAGYLTHNPNRCDWERDEDGSDYVVVPLSNSDLLFLRDQLNVLFPVAALPAPADDVVEALQEARHEIAKYSGIGRAVQHWESKLLAKIDAALAKVKP